MCLDVSVKRGAECNTDHHLLCARLRLCVGRLGRKVKARSGTRFDVSEIVDASGMAEEEDVNVRSVREEYLDHVLEVAGEA